jgi:transketolase
VVDGHNHAQIKEAIEAAKTVKGKPTMVVCRCIKGKDVSFMENQYSWHGTAPNQEQRDQAISELDAKLATIEAEIAKEA